MAETWGDYTIDAELPGGRAWRATDGLGRRVVLKLLLPECCPRGQLHPSIRLRLQRLRELPLSSFVNLIGVERLEPGPVLVSEYVEGVPFDQAVRQSPGDGPKLLRELRLSVMAMHQLGLVHGAIRPGNVIVQRDGQIKLIDPSPLLHDDPALDLAAVERMAPPDATPESANPAAVAEADRRPRQRALLAAVALLVLGVVAAASLAIYFGPS